MRAFPLLALVCGLAILASPAQKKKDRDEVTQTLEIPKDLPAAVIGETRRLNFYVTPLSAKGLLSQQIRDALKAVDQRSGRDTILKIRAFVAGSGDMRRVRDMVSEVFTDRRQPLPALSLIRSGGLPLEGAQVVLEAIASSRKEVNPAGLVFISGHPAVAENPLARVPPLAQKTLASMRQALSAAGTEPANVLRVSCFLSSLESWEDVRKQVIADYPRAAHNFVQTQRAPSQALASCEAVARMRSTGSSPVQPAAARLQPEAWFAPFARVTAPRVVLTGTQVSFGYEEKDARLAFERLGKALEQAGTSFRDVAYVHYYPLAHVISTQVRKVRAQFFDSAHPPAGSLLLFEGLPSMDAGFAVDVVAVRN
jgi:enamine deaminase RidA (YjgF/YER057c/UK114 family)